MNVWAHNLQILAAFFYLLAFVAGISVVFGNKKEIERGQAKRSTVFLLLAFVLQTAGLLWEGLAIQRCPLGSISDVLEIISWSLVVMFWIVGTAYRMSLLGLFTSALAAIFAIAASFAGGNGNFGVVSPTILAHAWLSLFSYGAFGIMAIVSTMYLLQLHGLKKRRFAPLFNLLPSLRELERVNFRLLTTAVSVYTVAIAIGAWRYFSSGGDLSAAKLFFAFLAWFGYFFALVFKLSGRLHGRRLAYALLIVFAIALAVLVPIGMSHAGNVETPQKETFL